MIYWRLASLPPCPPSFYNIQGEQHDTFCGINLTWFFMSLLILWLSCHRSQVLPWDHFKGYLLHAKFHMSYYNILQKNTKIYWSIYLKGNRWLSISETCTVTIINIQRKLAVGIIRGDLRNICNSDISVCYYFVPLSLDLGTPWGTTRLFTALDLQRMSSVGVHTPLLPPPWRRPLAVSLMFFSQIPTVLPRKQVCCAGWPVAAGVS